MDSKTNTPVSSASVDLGGATAKTDADGKANVKAPLGTRKLIVKKEYYKTASQDYFVGFKKSAGLKVQLQAIGRQVPVVVTNKVTGKPLAGAEIRVLSTSAKTNSQGKTTIVLPSDKETAQATITHSGFNTTKVSIKVTDKTDSANGFMLTPAGKIYFLSNLNGTIDVVKTNLDGTSREIVLAGTGKEDKRTTSLLASRDWRYVVLKSKRDAAQPSLYLIDTKTDKVTTFDEGTADYSLIGWYEHKFIYQVVRPSVQFWQNGREAIKSYDAEQGQLNQLDQTTAEGSSTSYAYQTFSSPYLVDNALIYISSWAGSGNYGGTTAFDLSQKNNVIKAVNPANQNKKDYKSFSAATTSYIQAVLYEPQGVYFAAYDNTSNKPAYYKVEDSTFSSNVNIDETTFTDNYPTYLLSPSSNQTFWSDQRDGKNTLFVGDAAGKNKKQVATLSDYAPYGWFGNDYVLVSKNGSELYIMPASGLSGNKQPVKITDYYKPAQTYQGYGYGYGGI
jgi:hypothetical protein